MFRKWQNPKGFIVPCLFVLLTILGDVDAEIIFEKKLVAAHAAPGRQVVTVSFPFQIKGRGVTVSKIDAPCECLGADIQQGGKALELPATLGKGQEGHVVAKFKTTGFRGIIDKEIFLKMAGREESQKITVRLHVPEVVEVSPVSQAWVVGGTRKEHSFKVSINYRQPVEITKHSCNNPTFDYELVTVRKGWEYLIKVRPKEVKTPQLGVLTVDTDCPIRAYARRKIFLVLKK